MPVKLSVWNWPLKINKYTYISCLLQKLSVMILQCAIWPGLTCQTPCLFAVEWGQLQPAGLFTIYRAKRQCSPHNSPQRVPIYLWVLWILLTLSWLPAIATIFKTLVSTISITSTTGPILILILTFLRFHNTYNVHNWHQKAVGGRKWHI